jgi:rhamnogalacturonan endolyase
MVPWRKIDFTGVGADQNIRLGDLTGDGNKEIVLARSQNKKNDVSCISAMTLEGKLMWQYGSCDISLNSRGRELPVQIHDLDGDGKREVIFVKQGKIHVLDGERGSLNRQVSVPGSLEVRTILFGDLLGTGRDNCMLVTDRESKLVVYNEKFEILWEREVEVGSQPVVYDMNGDGHDEVLMGFSAFDHEGNLLFNNGDFIGDQCNGITVTEMIDGETLIPSILYAAGDWGMLYVDFEGNILKQNITGHVQYISVADFDMESPGLETITSNRWGSDGLVHFIDASGKVRKNFIPASGVSMCVPVNWKGDGEEFFIVNADSISGGMYDKYGQLSVRFPNDGHPVTCYMVHDLNGDARDEVLVWNNAQLWIYTQDDNPRMGNTYHPDRIPFYNYSTHQMNQSLPGW